MTTRFAEFARVSNSITPVHYRPVAKSSAARAPRRTGHRDVRALHPVHKFGIGVYSLEPLHEFGRQVGDDATVFVCGKVVRGNNVADIHVAQEDDTMRLGKAQELLFEDVFRFLNRGSSKTACLGVRQISRDQ